jgi:hypothetical protein
VVIAGAGPTGVDAGERGGTGRSGRSAARADARADGWSKALNLPFEGIEGRGHGHGVPADAQDLARIPEVRHELSGMV